MRGDTRRLCGGGDIINHRLSLFQFIITRYSRVQTVDILQKKPSNSLSFLPGLGSEKNCRRIKSGRIPFSPEASLWIKRTGIYRTLLRFHAGKKVNRGNLKRAARRCGIAAPFRLGLIEIRTRLKICKEKCHFFRRHGHRYRRQHLQRRLVAAQKSVNAEDRWGVDHSMMHSTRIINVWRRYYVSLVPSLLPTRMRGGESIIVGI